VLWSPRDLGDNAATGGREQYVPTLRIYPHAMRAANAYYSPQKKALLFGYFDGPTGTVFSCLSQDVVAHETTHALLDGMHRRYIEDNHQDTLAFHEAFADIVALFQHFSFPQVLAHQIARTRGDLEAQSLLGELAQEFGVATGRYGALRSAIGETGEDGVWRPIVADPKRLAEADEPHERGAILVAAVFAAFLAIYKVRSHAVLKLASGGTGILAQGALPPNVVDALAAEANKTASHFLQMCIRALDYCPPFDITFGDYLRALVTADYDMVPDDRLGYRVALIESFRRWGIVPEGLKTLSEEQLRWPYARLDDGQTGDVLAAVGADMRSLIGESLFVRDRGKVFETLRAARARAHELIAAATAPDKNSEQRQRFAEVTGLNMTPNAEIAGLKKKATGMPSFEVHSVLPALRVSPGGAIIKQLIITLTQRLVDTQVDPDDKNAGQFDFRGGSTLIFDLDGEAPALRYAITRPILDEARLQQVRAYKSRQRDSGTSLRQLYMGHTGIADAQEPFCMLHSHL
jgi:hypothetical protein